MLYKNILLIDDDPEDASLFLDAVDLLGRDISVRWIGSPEQALDELKTGMNVPDLIFLDYNMPRINGLEMLGRMKNNSHLAGIAVILISSPAEEFMDKSLQDSSIMRYIKKPNSFAELTSLLDAIL
ncbi:CheY-like chemotaxis protein [Flavobacterium sp. 2755]|uniref:response regulator n=1 Tax=Flavobacterium sp. 2755 TaxID=2817765 RepID=UPI002862B5FD|nr:response regulator [Flavobacterium sp. 2755]MDR6764354.1 CheY-like chemotaxis protein [Flavobacterium sp. 2755]